MNEKNKSRASLHSLSEGRGFTDFSVKYLLEKLPQDSTYYHLYVVEKIRQGVGRAQREGVVSQDDVELKLEQWLTQ